MPSYLYLEKRRASKGMSWMCEINFDRLERNKPGIYAEAVQWFIDQGLADNSVVAEQLFRASGHAYGCCGLKYYPYKDGPAALLESWSEEEQKRFSLIGAFVPAGGIRRVLQGGGGLARRPVGLGRRRHTG